MAWGGLFRDVPEGDAQAFDLVVFRSRGVDDHVGIVIEPGWMLHAEPGQYSRPERYDRGRMEVRPRRIVRYDPQAMTFAAPMRDQVNLVAFPSISGMEQKALSVPPGTTLGEMVQLAFPASTEEQRSRMRVSISDNVIYPERWHRVKPRSGTLVRIDVAPGASFFRSVLSVLVTVAALTTSAFLTASGNPLGAALAAAAITVGGTLALNYLFRPKDQENRSKELYTVEGFKNEARPNEPAPTVFGRVRRAPVYAGAPYLRIVGDSAYTRALFLESLGDVTVNEQKFGETLLSGFHGVSVQVSRPSAPVALSLYDHQVLQAPAMGVTLQQNISNVRNTALDTQYAEVIFLFSRGLFSMNDDGERESQTVNVSLSYRLAGSVGAWTVASHAITAEKTEPFFRVFRIDFPVRGQYEVRAIRTDADQTEDNIQDTIVWFALYSHRPEAAFTSKVPATLTAIEVLGTKQLNGTVDFYNSVVHSVIPSWDTPSQTWIVRETSNPGDLCRYALQGPQVAVPYPDDEINLIQVREVAEYATTKGLEYNAIHQDGRKVIETLTGVAAAGRSIMRHDGQQFGFSIDRPQSVVRGHLTAHNSADFTKRIEWTDFPDAVMVVFTDAANGYTVGERLVLWPGFIGTATVIEKWDLPWINNAEAAARQAYRMMLELIHRRITYTVNQDIESLSLSLDEGIVYLNHPKLVRGQGSARVIFISGSEVVLDDSVTMEPGRNYLARWREITDSGEVSHTRTVVNVEQETASLLFSGSGALPAEGDLIEFGEDGSEARETIIKQIDRSRDFGAQIILVDHAPHIDALTDALVVPAWNPRFADPVDHSGAPAPNAPTITGISSGDFGLIVSLSPAVSGSATASYEVDHRISGGGGWATKAVAVGSGAAVIQNIYTTGQIVDIRARAIGYNSLASVYTATVQHTMLGGSVVADPATFDKTATRFDSTAYRFDRESP